MKVGARVEWPVPVQAIGSANAATVVFRHRSAFHLSLIVKASFQWVQGGRAQPVDPAPIERRDRFWDDDPQKSPERALDLAPFLPRAEIVVVGHAYAPASLFVPASSVRLGVFRDVALLEKTIHVYGDRRAMDQPPRPFQRMPLRWELAAGGPGTVNPVGAGGRPGVAPNLVGPSDPRAAMAFAPVAAGWPGRLARAGQLHGLEPPLFDLGDEFDFGYFQSAPDDQQVDALGGDEWLLLDGMHPSLPRLSTQLPGAYAEGLVWCEHGPSAGMRWSPPLALDTVIVDADRLRLDLVWRGSFTLPEGDAMVADVRAAAGLNTGLPMAWPDVDAALEARRWRDGPPPRPEVSSMEATGLHRQETSVLLPAISEALPFARPESLAARERGPITLQMPATPWDAPRPPMPSFSDTFTPPAGVTPLPEEGGSAPALPFQQGAPDSLDAVTDAQGGEGSGGEETSGEDATYDALVTGSTAPPPPDPSGESPGVDIPPPPRAPVVVPPPAVGTARVLGAFSLRYGDASQALPPPGLDDVPLAPPPLVVPAATATSEPPGAAEASVGEEGASSSSTAPARVSSAPSQVSSAPAASVGSVPPRTSEVPGAAAPEANDARGRAAAKLRAGESLASADLAQVDLTGLDFTGANLTGANLAGASLRGCPMVGAKLGEAKLQGADLEGADLSRADLTRADLARARLVDTKLCGALLAHAVLQGVEAAGADLSEAKGSRATFARARLEKASLVRAELANADFAAALLDGVDARGAQLADAVLDDARAEGSSWEGARLVRVRGHGAKLARATLVRAEATGSSWDRAELDGADLSEAVLTDASLLRASLRGAKFRGADLRGAKLANAIGDGGDYEGARLDGADLRQARLDESRFVSASLVKLVGTKASLERADLGGADLRGANLRGAKLKLASLERASLRDADLRDADLEDARLDGADRTGVRLAGANLDGATGIEPEE